jgi:hypothetical protein
MAKADSFISKQGGLSYDPRPTHPLHCFGFLKILRSHLGTQNVTPIISDLKKSNYRLCDKSPKLKRNKELLK